MFIFHTWKNVTYYTNYNTNNQQVYTALTLLQNFCKVSHHQTLLVYEIHGKKGLLQQRYDKTRWQEKVNRTRIWRISNPIYNDTVTNTVTKRLPISSFFSFSFFFTIFNPLKLVEDYMNMIVQTQLPFHMRQDLTYIFTAAHINRILIIPLIYGTTS